MVARRRGPSPVAFVQLGFVSPKWPAADVARPSCWGRTNLRAASRSESVALPRLRRQCARRMQAERADRRIQIHDVKQRLRTRRAGRRAAARMTVHITNSICSQIHFVPIGLTVKLRALAGAIFRQEQPEKETMDEETTDNDCPPPRDDRGHGQ